MEYLPTKWIKNGHNQGEMKVNILYMDPMGYIIIAFLCWEKCPFQLFKKQNISRQIWRDSVFLTFSRRSKTIRTKTISNGIMPMPQVKSQNKESRLFRSYRYFRKNEGSKDFQESMESCQRLPLLFSLAISQAPCQEAIGRVGSYLRSKR